jgi:hypothetical protein
VFKEETVDLVASQRPPKNCQACSIRPVYLKHLFRNVQLDSYGLHDRWSQKSMCLYDVVAPAMFLRFLSVPIRNECTIEYFLGLTVCVPF